MCVHNFAPVIVFGISLFFCSGTIEVAGISLGIAGLGTCLGYQWHKNKRSKCDVIISPVGGNGMMPEDPEEKERKRNQAREDHKVLTNKEARDLAKQHGYREAKNHPCGDTRNKPVFTNGKNYISPDADGHGGGSWKVFNKKGNRLGTWSIDLTKNIRG
ncbi:MAG TPA: toxin C-terminal domain-containing protein [Candidatus Babeliales bacterium]|nr:toxin C-terminal domain-containing protein [Candidatus Babeliales bacterium]